MSFKLAIDFDGTLVEKDMPLRWRPGAWDALLFLKQGGFHLTLFSARCTPLDPAPDIDDEVALFYENGKVALRVEEQWGRFQDMRNFLQMNGAWDLFDDIWQSPGKPHVDRFIDDSFDRPDWAILMKELGHG